MLFTTCATHLSSFETNSVVGLFVMLFFFNFFRRDQSKSNPIPLSQRDEPLMSEVTLYHNGYLRVVYAWTLKKKRICNERAQGTRRKPFKLGL